MSAQARFHFSVDGLWIARSAMGASQQFELDNRRLRLDIPGSSGAFGPAVDLAWMQTSKENGELNKAEAIVLRVTAELESDLLADEYQVKESEREELTTQLEPAWRSAQRLVGLVIEWVGMKLAQSQHAPSARVAPSATGQVTIVDRNGDRFPLSWVPPFEVEWRGEVNLLDVERLEEISDAVRLGERPSRPRQLLADAEFHAFHAADRNAGVALVLAAVACEMAVKTFMREACSADQLALVELVIENPRDVSIAAASLYDKGLRAVNGQSLRESDRELYKALTAVFEHRNRFAHGRELGLSGRELSDDLNAARRAINYLESLDESV